MSGETKTFSIEKLNFPAALVGVLLSGAVAWATTQAVQQSSIRKEFSDSLALANKALSENLTKNREEMLNTVQGLKDDLQLLKADIRVDIGELRHKLDLQELRVNANDSHAVWAALSEWVQEVKKENPTLNLPPAPIVAK